MAQAYVSLMKNSPFEGYKKSELLSIARERKVKYCYRMNKMELVVALSIEDSVQNICKDQKNIKKQKNIRNSLDLSSNLASTLKEIACGYGIPKYYSLNKAQLVEAITSYNLNFDMHFNIFEVPLPTKPLPSHQEIEQALGFNKCVSEKEEEDEKNAEQEETFFRTLKREKKKTQILSEKEEEDKVVSEKTDLVSDNIKPKTRKLRNMPLLNESIAPSSLFKLGSRMNLLHTGEKKHYELENISSLGVESSVPTFEETMCARKRTSPLPISKYLNIFLKNYL